MAKQPVYRGPTTERAAATADFDGARRYGTSYDEQKALDERPLAFIIVRKVVTEQVPVTAAQGGEESIGSIIDKMLTEAATPDEKTGQIGEIIEVGLEVDRDAWYGSLAPLYQKWAGITLKKPHG